MQSAEAVPVASAHQYALDFEEVPQPSSCSHVVVQYRIKPLKEKTIENTWKTGGKDEIVIYVQHLQDDQ